MKLSELPPSPALRPWISRYWSWQNEACLPPLLPGSGAELFFWYRQPVGIARAGEVCTGRHGSALMLPRDSVFHFHFTPPVSFIAVRFRTGALRHFSPLPEAELIDTEFQPADIWGKDIIRLEQQIAESGQLTEQLLLIEHFLTKILRPCWRHPWLDEAARQMYYYHQTVTQSELVIQSGFSARHFQQLFRRHYGVAPRHFQRITRLEQLIRHLLLNRRQSCLESALEYGYYDQSHFINDFRGLTGLTPSCFFQESNFSAHFYNLSSSG